MVGGQYMDEVNTATSMATPCRNAAADRPNDCRACKGSASEPLHRRTLVDTLKEL